MVANASYYFTLYLFLLCHDQANHCQQLKTNWQLNLKVMLSINWRLKSRKERERLEAVSNNWFVTLGFSSLHGIRITRAYAFFTGCNARARFQEQGNLCYGKTYYATIVHITIGQRRLWSKETEAPHGSKQTREYFWGCLSRDNKIIKKLEDFWGHFIRR